MKHRINIQQLKAAYQKDIKGWHGISDTTEGSVKANLIGGATATGHGFKFHISIEPSKIAQAAIIIADTINNSDCPEIGIKFSSQHLADSDSRQPSKQAAFAPVGTGEGGYLTETELQSFIALLAEIDKKLFEAGIGLDPKPFNADNKPDKFDAVVPLTDGAPSRFGYRNENCVILVDELYQECVGAAAEDITPQGDSYLVRKSYFDSLPMSQRHNAAAVADPFAAITLPNHSVVELDDAQTEGMAGKMPLDITSPTGLMVTDDEEDLEAIGKAAELLELNKRAIEICMQQAIDAVGSSFFSKIGSLFMDKAQTKKNLLSTLKSDFVKASSEEERFNAIEAFQKQLNTHRGVETAQTTSGKFFQQAISKYHLETVISKPAISSHG